MAEVSRKLEAFGEEHARMRCAMSGGLSGAIDSVNYDTKIHHDETKKVIVGEIEGLRLHIDKIHGGLPQPAATPPLLILTIIVGVTAYLSAARSRILEAKKIKLNKIKSDITQDKIDRISQDKIDRTSQDKIDRINTRLACLALVELMLIASGIFMFVLPNIPSIYDTHISRGSVFNIISIIMIIIVSAILIYMHCLEAKRTFCYWCRGK